jgi:hypothetical protein
MKKTDHSNLLFIILIFVDIISGLAIAWVDSRPGWDDTGVTAGLLLIVTFISGFIYQKKMWLWAILTGIWIPLHNIIKTGNFAILFVLAIAFAGAYAGGFIRRAFKTE